jgi:hypothetical protein
MIVQITPPAISNIGWRFYIVFAVLNFLWLPIIYFFFPETKRKSALGILKAAITMLMQCLGLELEDVDRLFAKKDSAVASGLNVDDAKDFEPVTMEKIENREIV